jgi:hypothetical protein
MFFTSVSKITLFNIPVLGETSNEVLGVWKFTGLKTRPYIASIKW